MRPDTLYVEPLKARVTMTETGWPAHISLVADAYGTAEPAEPGWFWIFASHRSAADIRRRGLHAVGTVTTTFIPPQTIGEVDQSVSDQDIPVVGTQEHTDAMIAEGATT
jgi:hypothetical protein